MNAFSGVLIRVSVFVGFIFLSTVCVKYSVADYYYENAKKHYDAIDVDKAREPGDLLPIYNSLARSLSWRANSPEALELKANTLYKHWWISPDAQFYKDSDLLQGANNFLLESLSFRKEWSYALSQLVLIHSNKEKVDNDFSHWYEKAYEIGRYEASIARLLMQVGLSKWSQFNGHQKKMTLDLIRISIEQKSNKPRDIRKIVQFYDLFEFVCGSLKDSVRKLEVCN